MKICPQCHGNNLEDLEKCAKCGALIPAHVPTVPDPAVFDPAAPTPDPTSITQYNQAPVIGGRDRTPTGMIIGVLGAIVLVLVGVLIGQSHRQAPVAGGPAPGIGNHIPVSGGPSTPTVPRPTYIPSTPTVQRPTYIPPTPAYRRIPTPATVQPPAAASAKPDVKAMKAALLAAAAPVIEESRAHKIPQLLGSKCDLRRVDVGDVVTNIEQTPSLTSPYMGDVSVTFLCTVGPDDFDRQIGEQGHQCTECRQFTFGWQGGKWVLTRISYDPLS